MFSIFSKKQNISNLQKPLSLSDARKQARILVIDDDVNAFPVDHLREEGYNIVYWENVQNLQALESGEYDIIILDIHGICTPELSSTGGIGILQHIKRYNPAQIVIAYSAKKYDFHQGDFWKLADDYLGKPSSLVICKQKIDDLLKNKYTVNYYWQTLIEVLRKNDVNQAKIAKLEEAFVQNTQAKRSLDVEQVSKILKNTKEIAEFSFKILHVISRLLPHGH